MRTTINKWLLPVFWLLAGAAQAGQAGQAGEAGPTAAAHVADATAPAEAAPAANAPDFALPPAAGGSNVRLSEHRGEVVLLTFWSSQCATCITQLAALDELEQTYRPAGLVTLGVSVEDDLARAARFAAAHPARFPLLLDRSKGVSRAYGIDRLPTTVLIDRRGRVHAVVPEFHGIDNSYVAQLRALLDDPL
jgi:peroxiredoxin